jgi:hypothetical protein
VIRNLAFEVAGKSTRRAPWPLLLHNGICENTAHARRPKQKKHGNENHRKPAVRTIFISTSGTRLVRIITCRAGWQRGIRREGARAVVRGRAPTAGARPNTPNTCMAKVNYRANLSPVKDIYVPSAASFTVSFRKAYVVSVRGERTWRA